jgi:hypothetical protein
VLCLTYAQLLLSSFGDALHSLRVHEPERRRLSLRAKERGVGMGPADAKEKGREHTTDSCVCAHLVLCQKRVKARNERRTHARVSGQRVVVPIALPIRPHHLSET